MQLSAITPLINTAEMTLAEKGISSAKVILTGFVVVFSVLVLLICIIKIYSAIVGKAQGAGFKKRKKQPAAPKKVERDVKPAVVPETPATEDTDAVPEEVIAVISAAVYSMYGGKDKVRIKSIKKSAQGRSAWANAGVLENTRPF